MTVRVQARLLPEHELVRFRQRQKRCLFDFQENFEGSLMRRAVLAHPSDVARPSRELRAELVDIALLATREEVALDVLDARLDLPLLRRVVRGCRVHFEAVEPRQLAVAAIELRRPIDRERRADHRRFQVVRDDGLDDTAELRERLHVQREPGLGLLVEADADHHVPAVAEHHHEAPRFAERLGAWIVELADVAEVDLRHRAGRGVDRDRDILRLDAACLVYGSPEALDRRIVAKPSDRSLSSRSAAGTLCGPHATSSI
jgi:hypothetical protein